MIRARRQSITFQNAVARLVLVNSAEIAMIGTTGSAPTIGTSTSGISAPVPYPATPPITEAIMAIPAMSNSSVKVRSARAASIQTFVMPGFMPGIHDFLCHQARRGWPGNRAFTPVLDGLCPAMTKYRLIRRRKAAHGELDAPVG